MHFKKLELIGFKSFADKTVLHFEPGITAVVGPNGCGKSNIFDSIRWVLGEQSIKELRGSQSQDVIFNGSDVKEPLSMAEVTLSFDNNDKFFPVEHNEVAITRRIFRSGESEYLLNKQQVRLKDILDLLMGTGIGAESYSLIQQGKIDLVLSARPEDRRLVFDEASGITKYKSQKREALRRLEETEQNLLRLNDIILEVKRQIGSLERQANKARKYKEVFEELKTREINLACRQKDGLNRQRNESLARLGELERKESEILQAIQEQESRISDRREELKLLENACAEVRSRIANLENLVSLSGERINFNRERIAELETRNEHLRMQKAEIEKRLVLDEEKLKQLKDEYGQIEKNIEEKTALLKDNEARLNDLTLKVKQSLENISRAKSGILSLASEIANAKNKIADSLGKQQIALARKKRLEIEKAKIGEEKAASDEALNKAAAELAALEESFSGLQLQVAQTRKELELENTSLTGINNETQNLEKELLAFQSQKEFLEKLRSKYEDIGESMNAVIQLDKLPAEDLSGLVVKIKELDRENSKLSGEAKPIDLNTEKISEKLSQIQHKIDSLKASAEAKQNHIQHLEKDMAAAQESLRSQEMVIIDKKAIHKNISEQFNKVKEEEEVVLMELSDVESELSLAAENLALLQSESSRLEVKQKETEDSILKEQENIASSNSLKEEALVVITQTRTEIEALTKRVSSDEATLKILEDTCNQDKKSLLAVEAEIKEGQRRSGSLDVEIKGLEEKIRQADIDRGDQLKLLKEKESQSAGINRDSSGVLEEIESRRKELDGLKNELYELQMQNKDVDFKILSLKERILQAYKMDLDGISGSSGQEIDEDKAAADIRQLKEKLDAYGTVNLVAIEEYDELKKRYDFLAQQQNDLNSAKESLHSAITKINRTTRQMFLETFEKVRVEFRNYFRLLFNGGDAQVFLIDEHDPLESGIEIICRPPGKKLQNVLLLSGGEKSLSAIALIFAIFKIKPAPFCVLDEIDAALDEANVDRFSRSLHEFAKISQFVVITHNKKTIANADIMYGITMQQSGISRIISVKFAQDKPIRDKEPDVSAVAEPV
ncbi:MAG: AAA family ATPase [Candidatus Omnitrophota bacterium]|jgi:chromosome segregation protein